MQGARLYTLTGALYRCVGYAAARAGIIKNDGRASPPFAYITVGFTYSGGVQRTLLSGEDVSDKLRAEETCHVRLGGKRMPNVPLFAGKASAACEENNVIMDGRDIGTVVLPNAGQDIFNGILAERARRRCEQLRKRGERRICRLEKSIIERDKTTRRAPWRA